MANVGELLADKFSVPAPIEKTGFIRRTFVLCGVLATVGLIALSCTDGSGAWCNQQFRALFELTLGNFRPSGETFSILHLMAEKSVHIVMYTLLGALLFVAFRQVSRPSLWVLVVGFAIGCGSELFQALFPTRDPALRDVLINWTGVVMGVVFMRSYRLVSSMSDRSVESAQSTRTREDLLALAGMLSERKPDSQMRGPVAESRTEPLEKGS